MYKYSPLDSIQVKNYMSVGDITINFKESPMVVLTGESESGKSAIIGAIATLFFNHDARDQKDYIRDGANGFGIRGRFQDGITISKIKTSTVNSYRIEKNGEEQWKSLKMDGVDVPFEVKKILGVEKEKETGEYLHYRNYDDKLLFVKTPGSVNYSVMYNSLKVERLHKAIKNGSNEMNEITRAIDEEARNINVLKAKLSEVRTVDMEPLLVLRERLKSNSGVAELLKPICNNLEKINYEKTKIKILSNLPDAQVDTDGLALLDKIRSSVWALMSMRVRVEKYGIVDNVGEMDCNSVMLLKSLVDAKNDFELKKGQLDRYADIESVEKVDYYSATLLENLVNTKNEFELKKSKVSGYMKLDSVERVDCDAVAQLIKIIELLNGSDSIALKANAMKGLSEAQTVDVKELDILKSICEMQKKCKGSVSTDIELKAIAMDEIGLLDKIYQTHNTVRTVKGKIAGYQKEEQMLIDDIRESGISLVKCVNCGNFTPTEGGCEHDD